MLDRTASATALAITLCLVTACGSTETPESPGDGSLIGAVSWHQKGPDYRVGLIRAAAGAIGGYYVALDMGGPEAKNGKKAESERAKTLFGRANRVTDMKKAIELLKEAVAADGTRPGPFNNLGLAYLATGNRKMAKDCFQKALGTDPGYRPAQENLDALQE